MSNWYTPKRMERMGYVRYPIPPGPNERFIEDLDKIIELVGSPCYETMLLWDNEYWIRRADD